MYINENKFYSPVNPANHSKIHSLLINETWNHKTHGSKCCRNNTQCCMNNEWTVHGGGGGGGNSHLNSHNSQSFLP